VLAVVADGFDGFNDDANDEDEEDNVAGFDAIGMFFGREFVASLLLPLLAFEEDPG
jgi:hypothetical protein